MTLREFLEFNINDELLSVYIEGSDGFTWSYKKDIPDGLKNRKVLWWHMCKEDLNIFIEGEIFADGKII